MTTIYCKAKRTTLQINEEALSDGDMLVIYKGEIKYAKRVEDGKIACWAMKNGKVTGRTGYRRSESEIEILIEK